MGWLSDPLAVYKAVRPKDWLNVPEYETNFIQTFVHVPQGETGYLAFEYDIEGYWVPYIWGLTGGSGGGGRGERGWRINETAITPDRFNTKYLTSNGMLQFCVERECRAQSDGSESKIYGFRLATHPDVTSPADFKSWNIVEIKARMSQPETLDVGSLFLTLPMLRFVTLIDGNEKRNVFIRF